MNTRDHAAEYARRDRSKLAAYRRETYWRRNQAAIAAGYTSYSAMRRAKAKQAKDARHA